MNTNKCDIIIFIKSVSFRAQFRRLIFIFLLFLCASFYFGLNQAEAATYYWVGGPGADVNSSANWTTSPPASCSGGGSGIPGQADTVYFHQNCDNGATISSDWGVTNFNMNAGYTGTVNGNPGVKLSVIGLVQDAGDLNITTLEHKRNAGYIRINGGSRDIDNYLSSAYANYAAYLVIATGQTISFDEFRISGTLGYIQASGSGTLSVGNLIYDSGSTALIYSGTFNVSGNITMNTTGTYSPAAFTVNLVGSNNQQILISTGDFLFSNTFTINKSGGAVTIAGNLKVYTFTLTQGEVGVEYLKTYTYNQYAGTSTIADMLWEGAGTFTAGSRFNATNITKTGRCGGSFCTIALPSSGISVNNLSLQYVVASGGSTLFSGNTFPVTNLTVGTTASFSGTISVTGNINTGIMSSNTGNINIIGTSTQSWTHTGATTGINTGRVTVNKASGTFTLTGDPLTLYDLTLTAGSISATTLSVSHTLTISAGTFTVTNLNHSDAGTITLGATVNIVNYNKYNACANGCQVSFPASGVNITNLSVMTGIFYVVNTLSLSGDFSLATGARVIFGTINVGGNITTGVVSSNTTNIVINGTGNQTWTHNGDASLFGTGSLTINKSSGTLSFSCASIYFTSITVSAGVVDLVACNLTVNGSVTLSGGTFNAGSGNVYFRSHFTHNAAATFNANTSTVYFYNTTATLTAPAGGTTFNNLIVNLTNSWGGILSVSGGAITVNGDFSLVQGVMGSGTFNLKGPNINLGPTGGNGTAAADLIVNGTSTQAVTIQNTTGTLPRLTMDNSLATASYNGTANINRLTLTNMSGAFDIGTNNFTSTLLTVNSGQTFSLAGTQTVTVSTATLNSSSTIEYTATTGSPEIKSWTYGTLKINGSGGTFSLQGNTTVANLDITAGTLNQGTYNVTTTATGGVTVRPSGSWLNTSTGDFVLGSGGVSNEGLISFVSNGNYSDGTNDIAITSTTNGSAQRRWTGSGIFSMYNVSVRDQGQAGDSSINVYYGSSVSNNGTNWNFNPAASPYRYWKGTTSNVWSVDSNWVEGSAPDHTQTAVFTSTYSNPASFDSSAVSPSAVFMTGGYASTITLAQDISLNSTYVQGGGVFNANGYGLTVASTASLSGGTFTAGAGTHNFNGGLTVSGGTYNGNGSVTNINGMFTHSSGTFNASTATTSVSGNFNRTGGTFNPNSGLVDLSGTNQSVIGNTTFANLRKVVTSAAALTFTAGQTTTITGTTTLRGASGQLLTLQSSSNGNDWFFDPQGGRDFAYLNVSDSNNLADEINAADHTGLTDALNPGSNTNWVFTIPVINITAVGTQVSTTTLPTTNKYMGGAFVATSSVAGSIITDIVLTQDGSLLTNYINDVRLYYDTPISGECSASVPVGALLFGNATSWVNGRATTTGSLSVGTSPVCIYPVFSLTGTVSLGIIFNTIDLKILNPLTDVVSSNASVGPGTEIDIPGSTLVDSSSSGLPTISMSIASTSIATDQSTTISWTTGNNVTSCTGSNDWSGEKGAMGTAVSTGILTQHRIYTFTLTCTNTAGNSSASVYVNVVHPNAPIITLSASPSTLDSGESSTLTWTTVGGINLPSSCTASGSWSGPKNVSGGSQVISDITSNRSFTLTCLNGYGSVYKTVSVGLTNVPVPNHCTNGVMDYDETAPDFGGSCGSSTVGGGIGNGILGDRVILIMPDRSDSIRFYFFDDLRQNALYMSRGTGINEETQKLTADNLNVVSGSFDEIECSANNCYGLRINLVLEKLSTPGSVQSYTIEKTFRTTAKVKTN